MTESAALFFTDCADYIITSLADTDTDTAEALPWAAQNAVNKVNMDTSRDLDGSNYDSDSHSTDMDEAVNQLDDTFHFKKSPLS